MAIITEKRIKKDMESEWRALLRLMGDDANVDQIKLIVENWKKIDQLKLLKTMYKIDEDQTLLHCCAKKNFHKIM